MGLSPTTTMGASSQSNGKHNHLHLTSETKSAAAAVRSSGTSLLHHLLTWQERPRPRRASRPIFHLSRPAKRRAGAPWSHGCRGAALWEVGEGCERRTAPVGVAGCEDGAEQEPFRGRRGFVAPRGMVTVGWAGRRVGRARGPGGHPQGV